MKRVALVLLCVTFALTAAACHTGSVSHISSSQSAERIFERIIEPDQNRAFVWATEGTDDQALAELEAALRAMDNVQDVFFRSKEDTLANYADIVGDATFESLQEDNPMLDGFEITIVDLALFDETIQQIESLENVDDISCAEDAADVWAALKSILEAYRTRSMCVLHIERFFRFFPKLFPNRV